MSHLHHERVERALLKLMTKLPGFGYRCVVDEHWTMLDVSTSAQTLLGYPPSVLLEGRVTYNLLIHPDDRQSVRAAVNEGVHTQTYFQMVYRVLPFDGQSRWVWEHGRYVGEDGGEQILEGYIIDIGKYEELTKGLSGQAEALGLVAAGIAHDTNNLLALGSSTLQYVLGTPLPDDTKEDLEEVQVALAHAAGLMQQMMQLARGERPTHDLTNVDDRLRQFSESLKHMFDDARSLELDFNAPGAHVRMPAGQLEVIIMNLVLNAIAAIDDSGTVRVSTSYSEDAHTITLRVRDDGCGIPPELHDVVFEPHYTTKAHGNGYGLANVKAQVEAIGGSVTLCSGSGDGACFELLLPLFTAPRKSEQHIARALLIEPNHIVRQISAQSLRHQGHDVVEVATQRDALLALSTSELELDSVIIGIITPMRPDEELAARLEHTGFPHSSVAHRLEDMPWSA